MGLPLQLKFRGRDFIKTDLKFMSITVFKLNNDNINTILMKNSILTGLMQYYITWRNLFGIKFIKLWIGGDSEENVEYIFICGMLPHDEYFFVNILIINETRGTAPGEG